jgi:hypothetical protein
MPSYIPNPPGKTLPLFGSPLVTSIGRSYAINRSSCGKTTGNAVLSGPCIKKENNKCVEYKPIKGAMPEKFYPSVGSSMFARARSSYTKDAGGGQNWYSSSQHIHLKKINAIGKSSQQSYVKNNQPLAFSGKVQNDVKSALRRTRSGGTVAPAKKGLYLPNINGIGTRPGVGGLANKSVSGRAGNNKQGKGLLIK